MKQSSWVKIIVAGVGLTAFRPAVAAEEKHGPNFVFILVDDLGWGDVGYNGCDCVRTPNVDALAEQGMVFNNAYAAAPYCSPSRAAILSGRSPAALHLTNWLPHLPSKKVTEWKNLNLPETRGGLPTEEITIAEVLKARGYRTATIGKWHVGEIAEEQPAAQGFDEQIAWWPWSWPSSWYTPYGELTNLKPGPRGEYLTDRLGDEACAFIERNREQPFFLNLWFYTVHMPLKCKKEMVDYYLEQGCPEKGFRCAVFQAMKECMDSNVGKVLSKLEELGLSENTVIVFTSDNGGPKSHADNGGLRGGKGVCYEGGIRVPCIVLWPGVTKPGALCNVSVIGTDWYPTLLEMAGVERSAQEETQKLEGLSLVPLLKDSSASLDRQRLCWHYPHGRPGTIGPHGAIREGKYKLIDFYDQNRWELYDLETDIGETNDLSRQLPETAESLRKNLYRWLKVQDAQMPSPK